jgi:hypothetical protein
MPLICILNPLTDDGKTLVDQGIIMIDNGKDPSCIKDA